MNEQQMTRAFQRMAVIMKQANFRIEDDFLELIEEKLTDQLSTDQFIKELQRKGVQR